MPQSPPTSHGPTPRDAGETGLYPLVENSAAIASIMQAAFDQCWMRQIDGADFASYNERVNALFR